MVYNELGRDIIWGILCLIVIFFFGGIIYQILWWFFNKQDIIGKDIKYIRVYKYRK